MDVVLKMAKMVVTRVTVDQGARQQCSAKAARAAKMPRGIAPQDPLMAVS